MLLVVQTAVSQYYELLKSPHKQAVRVLVPNRLLMVAERDFVNEHGKPVPYKLATRTQLKRVPQFR